MIRVATIWIVAFLASSVVGQYDELQEGHHIRRRERMLLYGVEEPALSANSEFDEDMMVLDEEWDRVLHDMSMDCDSGKGGKSSKKGTNAIFIYVICCRLSISKHR